MGIERQAEVLKQVAGVAALAGLKGRVDDEGRHFQMVFDVGGGRSQAVYVRPSGKTPDGNTIVTLFSPAHSMKKGLFAGLGKEQALELLRLNERTYFARFGLWEADGHMAVVASVDHLLNTLDAEELRVSALWVAKAADEYERKHGGDKF